MGTVQLPAPVELQTTHVLSTSRRHANRLSTRWTRGGGTHNAEVDHVHRAATSATSSERDILWGISVKACCSASLHAGRHSGASSSVCGWVTMEVRGCNGLQREDVLELRTR
jgi:hypothetical protein